MYFKQNVLSHDIFSCKLKMYSAIPYLVITPKELKAPYHNDISTPMFIVPQFVIDKS